MTSRPAQALSRLQHYPSQYAQAAVREWKRANLQKLQHLTSMVPQLVREAPPTRRGPAAVLDLDETVFCSIDVNTMRPDPILMPGADLLLGALNLHRVPVYFVTGRIEAGRNATILQIHQTGANSILRGNWELRMRPNALTELETVQPWKEGVRGEIAREHHIILNAGDQLSDMGRHGRVQFLLPNPFYFVP